MQRRKVRVKDSFRRLPTVIPIHRNRPSILETQPHTLTLPEKGRVPSRFPFATEQTPFQRDWLRVFVVERRDSQRLFRQCLVLVDGVQHGLGCLDGSAPRQCSHQWRAPSHLLIVAAIGPNWL